MSQNPEDTPDQPTDQGRSSSAPGSDPYAASTPDHSGEDSFGDSGERPYGSSTSPSGSPDSGSSTSPTGSQDPVSSTNPYGQSQDPGSSAGSYGQSQYGQGGYDQNAGQAGEQGGYPQYGQQADPNYGQAQYPPSQSQPYAQQVPGGSDPNAQYGAPNQAYPPQQYAQPGYPQYAGQAGQPPVSESDEKLWGLLAHISIPFIGFIGPLIVYLIYKDRSPWLKDTSTEALNFSILYSIASLVCSLLIMVLIGAILLPLVFIGALIFCILAALAANRHEFYRYPINWRIIK